MLSCKKGRPDRNLRDLRADEDEQTGGSGLSETVDRPGLRKNRRKKHLRLPHRAGTDPGRGMPLMGIYYMEKTCPRRLAGEFKNYKEQIRLHVKKEDSYFELFCTAPEEKNCSLVCGPRNRLGKSRRRKRKSPDPNRRF